MLRANLPDPAVRFLTLSLKFHFHFLTLLSLLCSVAHLRHGALFGSLKKSKEMEKVQLRCRFLVVQHSIVILWPDILLLGKGDKKIRT